MDMHLANKHASSHHFKLLDHQSHSLHVRHQMYHEICQIYI